MSYLLCCKNQFLSKVCYNKILINRFSINNILNIHVKLPNNGKTITYNTSSGKSIKDIVDENNELQEYLECACGGIAACSTCHVIIDKNFYELLNEPEDYELDMIDLAWGPTKTSRLACQTILNDSCNDLTLTIPNGSNNLH